MRSVSVVIPTLNEAHNLPLVLDALPPSVTEVVIVDGGSKDDTVAVARRHRSDAVILGQHSPGKGAATVAGLLAATGDIVVLMDADCSMAPADIDRFIDALVAGNDVVHGSRGLDGGGSSDFTKTRSAGNSLLTTFTNLLFGVRWTDLTFGYAALWQDVIASSELGQLIEGPSHELYREDDGGRHRPKAYGHGFEIEVLILCRAARGGLKVQEISSFEHKRRHGTSHLSAIRDGSRVLWSMLHERVTPKTRYHHGTSHADRVASRRLFVEPPTHPAVESSSPSSHTYAAESVDKSVATPQWSVGPQPVPAHVTASVSGSVSAQGALSAQVRLEGEAGSS